MSYLLYIALAYLLITSMILFRNRKDFTPLMPATHKFFENKAPLVTVCIPARNEEKVIERCVCSALNQSYPGTEVLVLDDNSVDATRDILFQLQTESNKSLLVIDGKPKPAKWLGKTWACHQLAKQARGNILLFIDADTWLEKDMVAKTVRTMGHDVIELLTVWPQQKLGTFWEKMIIPLVYYALLSLLPARYVYKAPRWIPKMFRKRFSPLFAAACGQCMAFKKEAYEAIGGHKSVKNEIVEDVALARKIKEHGFRMKMYHGRASISCRMYTSLPEIRQGFGKNFLAGFNDHIPVFIGMALLHLIVYVLPFLVLPVAVWLGYTSWIILSAMIVVFILFHRVVLARWFGWSMAYAFLHPVAVLWFQKLGIEVLVDYLKGKQPQWKGRDV